MKFRQVLLSLFMLWGNSLFLFGAAGRVKDRLSFVIAVLGFFGIVLGLFYLYDLVKAVWDKLINRDSDENDTCT